jgi:hypothetical protein
VGVWGVVSDIHGIWNFLNHTTEPTGTATDPLMTEIESFNSKFGLLLIITGTMFDVVQVIAGAFLLQLRVWARTALEVVAWSQILILAIGPMLRAIYLACFTNTLADWSPEFIKSTFLILGLSCVWACLLYGPIIYFLRSQKVREAVSGGAGKTEATATV